MSAMSQEKYAQCIELLIAGFDILVDDMLIGNPSGSNSFHNRISLACKARDEAQAQTGRFKLVLAALTGSPRQMYHLASEAQRLGANGFVVNAFVHGLGVIEDLREMFPAMTIVTTNMGSGMASRPPKLTATVTGTRVGVHEQVYSKLSRLAGADAVHAGTTGTSCFDVPWGDAIRALDQRISRGASGPDILRSFRVAEGSLRFIDVWKNTQELGTDTILEFPLEYLILLCPRGRRDFDVVATLLRQLAAVTTIDQAHKAYLDAAGSLPGLRKETDEAFSPSGQLGGPKL